MQKETDNQRMLNITLLRKSEWIPKYLSGTIPLHWQEHSFNKVAEGKFDGGTDPARRKAYEMGS